MRKHLLSKITGLQVEPHAGFWISLRITRIQHAGQTPHTEDLGYPSRHVPHARYRSHLLRTAACSIIYQSSSHTPHAGVSIHRSSSDVAPQLPRTPGLVQTRRR